MAKPSEKDIECGGKLMQILNAIDGRFGGPFPTDGPEDLLALLGDDEFDSDRVEHLQALYNSLAALLRTSASFHNRIIAGMCYVIMYDKNEIIDPDSDTLDLHPRFKAPADSAVPEPDATLAVDLLSALEASTREMIAERDCFYEGCSNDEGVIPDDEDRDALSDMDAAIDRNQAVIARAKSFHQAPGRSAT
ncbi:MAG: hypothetical protein Q8L20_11060 [Gammaproteobacteria bacterium]|nr:hypothetical protein [Gammaproteobacteria bacterium]